MKRILLNISLISISFLSFTQDLPKLIPYRKGDKFGFVDQSKKVKIRFKYDDAGIFCNGYAWVKKKNKYSYINEKGKLISKFLFDEVTDFNESLEAQIKIINPQTYFNYWEVLDKKGNILGRAMFNCAGVRAYANHLVRPYKRNGKYGALRKVSYRSQKFDTLFKEKYDSIYFELVEGYLHVKENNKWGVLYFDKEIVSPKYDFIGSMCNEMNAPNTTIIIKNNRRMGFINNTGSEIIVPEYESVLPFKDGLSRVILNKKPGYIDIKGNKYFE